VVQVCNQLIAEGWLVGTPGSGTRVADVPGGPVVAGAVPGQEPADRAKLTLQAIDLRPGRPDLSSFPRPLWATSVRRAVTAMRPEILDYDQFEPAGLPVLRAAIADYVARTCGVRATAESVVVVAEFTQGRLALVARAPRRLGARCAATEDPGFGLYRNLLGAAGLRAVRLRVGDGGAAPRRPDR
jgi:GntR family transcriptional regulator / MocR family aminotransferase